MDLEHNIRQYFPSAYPEIQKRHETLFKGEGWHSKYPSVDKALRHYARRIKSEKTRENFCGTLMRSCKYCGKNPEELVKLSVEEASSLCQSFTDNLMDKGCSVRCVNACQAYLMTFFRENGFEGARELKTEHYYQPVDTRRSPNTYLLLMKYIRWPMLLDLQRTEP